jgi:hypothetical protein
MYLLHSGMLLVGKLVSQSGIHLFQLGNARLKQSCNALETCNFVLVCLSSMFFPPMVLFLNGSSIVIVLLIISNTYRAKWLT